MAEVIIMPKLGFNMDEGQLVKWHKSVGDIIQKGELLFEINTDKTTMPVEATEDGVLLKTMLQENEFAPVFTPIAVLGQEGENPETALKEELASKGETEAHNGNKPEGNSIEEELNKAKATGMPGIDLSGLKLTPRAKKYIDEEGIDIQSVTQIQGTGYQGGITQRDIAVSPLARKIAEIQGINLKEVTGTGAGGKIMKADVLSAAPPKTGSAMEDSGTSIQVDDGAQFKQILSEQPYKGVRKIIGDRLAQSKFTSPHLYFTDAVDTTNLTDFRAQLNLQTDIKIAVSDLLVLAAGKCLQKYPDINASLIDERIVRYKSVNVGTAVAGNNGLVVPVIKNVQNKTLTQIAAENKDLIARAKEGKLAPQEYGGGTFTISNLGMFGIGNFTAIINPPEAAILSVSSVRKMPVVVTGAEGGEDQIMIRPMMNVQLTVDHRIIDGLMAAQFVGYFKYLVENPLQIVI